MLFLSKMVLLLIDSAPEEKVSCLKTMLFYLFTLSYELLQKALPETVSRIFFDLKMCSHFIVAAVDSSLFKKQQKNWFSPQSTQKCGVSSCHSAGTQLMGLSHGVMCSSHFCVQHWLPRCWQQRKSHSSEAEHGIFLLCPEWTGDSSGSCAQSWLCGQWAAPAKLTVAPSTACPPQAQPWLQVPSWHSWHISALPGESCAGAELWEGVPRVAVSGMLPHKTTRDGTEPPGARGWFYRSDFSGVFQNLYFGTVTAMDFHLTLMEFTPRQGLGKQPLCPNTAQIRGRAGLVLSVPAQRAALLFCSSALSFPHINTCQPLKCCEISVLSRLGGALRPVPGKCCRNVKHPYGWPYHWERNLKSDLFVWLPESHCCIIHDSLLFFRRLILLPSPSSTPIQHS